MASTHEPAAPAIATTSDSTPGEQEHEIHRLYHVVILHAVPITKTNAPRETGWVPASRRHLARVLLPKTSEILSPLWTRSSNPPRAVSVKAEQAAHGPFLQADSRLRPSSKYTHHRWCCYRAYLNSTRSRLFARLWPVPFIWPSIQPSFQRKRG